MAIGTQIESSPSFPINLRLLGIFDLKVHGVSISGTPKAVQALLTLLVGRQTTTPLTRPAMAAILWPDATPERANFYLRRTLTQLRAAFGPERGRIRADLTLDLSDCYCDLTEFTQHCKSRPELAEKIYSGDLAVTLPVAELESVRTTLKDRFISVLTQLASVRQESGQTGSAIETVRRIILADPTNESAWQFLMQLQAASGDFAGLARAHRELRSRLNRELGIEPKAETTELYHRLMREAPVFSAGAEPLEIKVPPAKLRTPLTSLVGRRSERDRLDELISRSKIVAIVGLGGVGKTRLALDLIERHSLAFGLSASHWQDHEEALKSLLNILGLSSLDKGEVRARYGQSEVLLVLDGVENNPEICKRLILDLLEIAPAFKVLLTTRLRLDWIGVENLHLKPLPVPDTQALFPAITGVDSVQLFVERARAADPEFRLTERNAESVIKICRQLDGLPLAIELAAARVHSFSAAEVCRRLTDRFEFLKSEQSNQALTIVLDWTYKSLTADQQALLHEVAFFNGSLSQSTIEATCVHFKSDRLAALVRLDLVQHNEGRYQCLESIKAYVRHIGGQYTGITRKFMTHYCDAIQVFSPALATADYGSAAEWFHHERENLLQALRLPLSVDDSELKTLAFRIHNKGFQFWKSFGRTAEFFAVSKELVADIRFPTEEFVEALFVSGHAALLLSRSDEAERIVDQAEAMAAKLGIYSWQGESLYQRSLMSKSQERINEAKALCQRALAIFEQSGDEIGQARCLGHLGYCERDLNNLEQAIEFTKRALVLNSKNNILPERLWCIGSLGAIYLQLGKTDLAIDHFREAIDSCHEGGEIYTRMWNLTMLGQAELQAGRLEEAAQAVREALELRGSNADDLSAEWAISLLGEILTGLGDYSNAAIALNRAHLISKRVGTSKNGIYTLLRLARLQTKLGRLDSAEAYLSLARDEAARSEVEGFGDFIIEIQDELSARRSRT